MTHNHTSKCLEGMVNGVCGAGFPRKYPVYQSCENYSNRIDYRTITREDAFIVPHNPRSLLRWRCHICVKYVANSMTPRYLYKYVR